MDDVKVSPEMLEAAFGAFAVTFGGFCDGYGEDELDEMFVEVFKAMLAAQHE